MKRIVHIILAMILSKTALAYDVSGIKIGDNFQSVKHLMQHEIISKPNFEGKKYGFMEHLSYKEGYSIRVSTRPDDTIYSVSYNQDFPVKQSESLKSMLCKKYDFSDKKCWWSKKYDDFPPNMGGILFSQGKREKGQKLSVNIEKSWTGRKLKSGYIALKLNLSVKRPTKEIDLWAKKLLDEKNRIEVQKEIESSNNDSPVKPMF